MKTNNIKTKRVIQRCGCDAILPLTLIYIFYIILHGHLSPGGGFQGGVLMVAAVLLVYLGHGYKATMRAFQPKLLAKVEGLALIAYVIFALLGIAYGGQFCQNVLFQNGAIGALHSSGTISLMDEAVALNVLCGVTILSLGMIGALLTRDVDGWK